jgi:hypothetical protein
MVRGAIYRQSSILASLWGEIRELPSGVVRTKRALVRDADLYGQMVSQPLTYCDYPRNCAKYKNGRPR